MELSEVPFCLVVMSEQSLENAEYHLRHFRRHLVARVQIRPAKRDKINSDELVLQPQQIIFQCSLDQLVFISDCPLSDRF
jgi:hypothetical protein